MNPGIISFYVHRQTMPHIKQSQKQQVTRNRLWPCQYKTTHSFTSSDHLRDYDNSLSIEARQNLYLYFIFINPEGPLSCLQESATFPYPQPDHDPVQTTPYRFSMIH
jgi:hypothetical protein